MIPPAVKEGMGNSQMLRLGCVSLIAAALLLSGCARNIEPTPADLKARWDAQNVYPGEYKKDLLAFLNTYLNDPLRVRSAMVSAPVLKYIGPGERYVVCVRYNARNSTGAYMGSKDGVASYVSGKLDHYFDQPREVRGLCNDAAFAPFPELERLRR